MKKKAIITLILIVVIVLFKGAIPVSATGGLIAAGGFSALVEAWTAAAQASGVSIDYKPEDFADYGSFDVNGDLQITDMAGARQKIVNDYTALATQTQAKYEADLDNSLQAYMNAYNQTNENYSNMTWAEQLEYARQLANERLLDEDLSIVERTELMNIANQITFIEKMKSLSLVGSETYNNSLEILNEQLTDDQRRIFNDFFKSSAGPIVNNKLRVAQGFGMNKSEIQGLPLVADTVYYISSSDLLNTTIFRYDSFSHSYSYSVVNAKTGATVISERTVDLSYGFNINDCVGTSLSMTDQNIRITGMTKNNHSVNIGNASISVSSDDYIIFSQTMPTVINNAIDIPVTDVDVKVGNPPLTTDKPVAIPTPDTILQDVIDNALPINVPQALDVKLDIDGDLPELKVPNTIIKKFPFSLPFDLYRGIKLLVVPPEPPKFTVDIEIPVSEALHSKPLPYKFEVDLSSYETLAIITRWGSTLAFTIGLIFVSSKIVKGAG